MNDLTTFQPDQTLAAKSLLATKHDQLGQLHLEPGKRSATAKNYYTSIKQFNEFRGDDFPTRGILEAWRDTMLASGVSVRTVNARLSAVRKLLRAVAADTTDLQVKLVFESWANVENAKAVKVQDETDADYGLRLALSEVQALVKSFDTTTAKDLRDRALLAVMVGAGLRVSEAVDLTMRDVFLTENESGQRGIKVRNGKHHKSRVVVLNGWNSWIIQAVEAYTAVLELTALTNPDEYIFRSVSRWGNDTGKPLSTRGAQRAIEALTIERHGKPQTINAHDLRRTYAKLCKASGMTWEALQRNMGHSSVEITQRYVGQSVDWSDRVPNWKLEL